MKAWRAETRELEAPFDEERTHRTFKMMPKGNPLQRVSGVIALAAVVALLGVRLSADDDDEGQSVPRPVRTTVVNGMPAVRLNAGEQKHAGVTVKTLSEVRHVPQRHGYAAVLDIRPLLGDAQLLSDAQSKMQSTSADREQAEAEYKRAQQLHEAGQNVSMRALQSAEAAWRRAGAAAEAARRSLAAQRATLNATWGPMLADWVKKQSAEFIRLSTGEDLLLRITLPGAPLDASPDGASVEAPDGTWVHATLISSAPQADPRFQQVAWFFRVPANPGLVPGLVKRANVRLAGVGAPQTGVVVPSSAVVWWQGGSWVYVQDEPDTFVRHRIATDQPGDQGGYFVTSLPDSPSVVVTGAEAILSEETLPAVAPEVD